MKAINFTMPFISKQFSAEQMFFVTIFLVNGGNYVYNLVLGGFLGP